MLTRVPRDLCQCCLLRLPDKDLKKCYRRFNENEVYSDMLRDCLQVQLWTQGTEVQGGICEICVMQLRDARDFKRQVERCQKQLEEHAQKQAEMEVKKEVVEIDSDTEFVDDDIRPDSPDFPEEPDEPKTPSLPRITSSVSVRLTRVDQKTVTAGIRPATKPGGVVRAGSADVAKASSPGQRKARPVSRPATADTATSDKNQPTAPKPKTKSKKKPTLSCHPVAKAHDFNVNQLMKHSNCTPFFTRTIAGIQCCFCRENILTLPLLKEHMQSTHTNDQYCGGVSNRYVSTLCCKIDITDLKCKLCEQNFDQVSSLKEHLMMKHDVKFSPEEKNCIIDFKLSEGEVMNCALCNSTFETFKSLLVHMNRHYRNFICKECDRGFMNKAKLRTHQETHKTGIFNCSFCPKVFTTKVKKISHENTIHRRGRYKAKCPHCTQKFKDYYFRNKHIFEEHNNTAAAYKCNICDVSFLLKGRLTSHVRDKHLMEKNFLCNECGQGFFTKQLLEDHMIRHSSKRIHKCKVCHKAYGRKKTLREHMRIHNNDKRFTCHLCGLAFVQKGSLKGHMLSKHGETLADIEEAKRAQK